MKANLTKKLAFFSMISMFFLISSCASKKDLIYFQGQADLIHSYEEFTPKIQPYDMLDIYVMAADLKATQMVNQLGSNTTASSRPNVYTVAEDGSIDFPLLGKVYLGGLTRNQAMDLIKRGLDEYIVDPGVNINFTNFKVSVIGEVARPGSYTLPNERISILEAIAMAGDLTIQGRRHNIMVIREENNEKKIYTVDLTSMDALNSPVYYLKQNDLVYVEPNQAKIQSSVVNYPVFISVAGIIISIVTLITR